MSKIKRNRYSMEVNYEEKSISILLLFIFILSFIIVIPNRQVSATEINIPTGATEFNNHFYTLYDNSITWDDTYNTGDDNDVSKDTHGFIYE